MIKYVLSKGGDTDTNAAIVGGMVGSIVGFKNLPAEYLRKLLQLRHNGISPKGRLRPVFYEPRYAFANAYKIIRMLISLK
jgi:ADP-ribosyl-[dinitrogen reductase] hydrolase